MNGAAVSRTIGIRLDSRAIARRHLASAYADVAAAAGAELELEMTAPSVTWTDFACTITSPPPPPTGTPSGSRMFRSEVPLVLGTSVETNF